MASVTKIDFGPKEALTTTYKFLLTETS